MRGWQSWCRWGSLCGAVLIILLLVTGWLMFQRIPDWYRPPAVAPIDQQRVKNDLVGTLDRLQAALLNAPGPFEFRLTQDQINEWLAVREAIWPEARHWVPPEMADPFIAFSPDGVRLAATYRRGSIRTVASTRLTVEADADSIRARLLEVAAGKLSVPAYWARERLAGLGAGRWRAGKRSSLQVGGPPLPPLEKLVDGAEFSSRWIWKNGDQPFRITGLKLEHGALVMTFEPLRSPRASR